MVAAALTAAAYGAAPGSPSVFDTPLVVADGRGEPEVAVDPLDSDVLVAAYSSGVARSTDGGHHWTQVLDGLSGAGASARGAGDPVVVADAHGNFYYSHLGSGAYTIEESTDGGKTWSAVGAPLHNPLPAGPSVPDMTVQPTDGLLYMGPSIIGCDRPLMTADQTNDDVYATCADHGDQSGGEATPTWEAAFLYCRTNIFSSGLLPDCGRRYVSVSHDHARTWSGWRPEDNSAWPAGYTGAFDGAPAAAFGVLATAYVAAAAPGSNCTQCVVFETSSDGGGTWRRTLVPDATVQIESLTPGSIAGQHVAQALIGNDSQAVWFEPYVAADPTRRDHFAVMVLDAATRTRLLVYQTFDGGDTWSGPRSLGDGVHRIDKPAMAYGPSGALGVMWKSVSAADLGFTVWAAVAPGPKAKFGEPAELSSAPSAEETCGLGGQDGQAYGCDELSWVVLDATHLNAAWGDNRSGQTVYFGRFAFGAG